MLKFGNPIVSALLICFERLVSLFSYFYIPFERLVKPYPNSLFSREFSYPFMFLTLLGDDG